MYDLDMYYLANKINKYLHLSTLILIFRYFLHSIRIVVDRIYCLLNEFNIFGLDQGSNRSIIRISYIILVYFSNSSKCRTS